MKKRVISVLGLTVLLLAVIVASSSADLAGGNYWFGSTVMNVGTGAATVAVTAYNSANANTHTLSLNLPVGGSATILPNGSAGTDFTPALPAGFTGSIVTSSDQPLAAVVNITNRLAAGFGDPAGKASGLYSGVDQPATTVSFPLAKFNFFNKTTHFFLQNAGSAAATIDVEFSVGGTAYNFTTASLAPGQMAAVDGGLAGVPASSLGSMTATSAQPIAGVMLEAEHALVAPQTAGLVFQASNGVTPGQQGDTLYCPVIKEAFFGRKTGLQVQNVHTVAQDITVTYQPGNIVSTAPALPPGESHNFLDDPNVPDNALYSATVEGSAGPIAAVVNESELPLVSGHRQTSTTYNCTAANQATNTVVYPAYKEVFFGRSTGLQIQNVGTVAATNVVFTFVVQGGGTFTTVPQTIQPGGFVNLIDIRDNTGFWSGAAMGAATVSGVTVTSDQPIIAIVNEASWTLNLVPDNDLVTSFDKANTTGFNLP
jgi:hypothetical protein